MVVSGQQNYSKWLKERKGFAGMIDIPPGTYTIDDLCERYAQGIPPSEFIFQVMQAYDIWMDTFHPVIKVNGLKKEKKQRQGGNTNAVFTQDGIVTFSTHGR